MPATRTKQDREESRVGVCRAALKFTTRQVYLHPGIPEAWRDDAGPRTEDGAALASWLESAPVQEYLDTCSYRRRHEVAEELLSAAHGHLAAEREAVRRAWQLLRSGTKWEKLSPSEQQFVTLLFALADTEGPCVILAHRAAIFGIEMTTDSRYRSLATITNAGRGLAAKGIIAVEAGSQWVEGKRAKSTRYNLLPQAVGGELAKPPGPLASSPEVEYVPPVLSEDQLALMQWCYAELRAGRAVHDREALADARMAAAAGRPEPATAPAVPLVRMADVPAREAVPARDVNWLLDDLTSEDKAVVRSEPAVSPEVTSEDLTFEELMACVPGFQASEAVLTA